MNSQTDKVNQLLMGTVKKGCTCKKQKMKDVFIGCKSNKPIKHPRTLGETYEDLLKRDKLTKLVSKYNR